MNEDCYTYDKRPVELLFQTLFNDINQAIAFEKQIKGWSRRKKEAIVNDQWEDLIKLSANSVLRQAQGDSSKRSNPNK